MIEIIKTSNFSAKIMIVSHSGTLRRIILYLTNIESICYGDLTKGSNCYISYIIYHDSVFKIL